MNSRDERIVLAATRLAREHGLAGVRRSAIATLAGMAAGTVSNYGRTSISNSPLRGYDAMAAIRAAVMHRAVATGDLLLVRQGIAAHDPIALAAPEQMRIAALAVAA